MDHTLVQADEAAAMAKAALIPLPTARWSRSNACETASRLSPRGTGVRSGSRIALPGLSTLPRAEHQP
jgi:hypothetical protein